MRILYIHQYFRTRDGAGSTRSYEFARLLQQKGYNITFVTTDVNMKGLTPYADSGWFHKYRIDSLEVIAVKLSYSNYMSYPRRIWSFFLFMLFACLYVVKNGKKFDLIYATSTPLTVAIPALLGKFLRRRRYVFEVRDLWPEAPVQMGAIKKKWLIRALYALENMAYTHADHIIALSPGIREGILSKGIPDNKVAMIPNSCDIELFENGKDDAQIEHYRQKYGLAGKFVVLHAGTIGRANGLKYVIDAAEQLKMRGAEDIVFLLVGDGGDKPNLEEEICRLKLTNVILTGQIPKKHIPIVYALSDLTITTFLPLPILATNSPNKFFDSLAAGRPVIVNSLGWTKELVENEQAGFYVDANDPSQLAELLIKQRHHKPLLKQMGENARELAKKLFDRKKLVEDLDQILASILESRKS